MESAGPRVNHDCVNASNPYHRCGEYCGAKRSPAAGKPRIESPELAQNGSGTNPKRRTERGGSGGLPLYVFLQNGSADDIGKVDPRCANASNPYHVCTESCLSKLHGVARAKVQRSPVSLFSRHSSWSSGDEGSVKVREDRKVDPRCANSSNPYHVCADYCFNKLHAIEQAGRSTPVENGTKTPKITSNMINQAEGSTSEENSVKIGENRTVDPRCKKASNPYHVCTENCLNRSSQMEHVNGVKPVSTAKESNGRLDMVEKRYVNPNCVNASNPYHRCSEYCSSGKQKPT
ncbi:uncharacterized protein [Typha angustifolia]|uniref:uncharacterized protein n=1 Tax=Typha angustifolia TaxID=59011 RepID=UPI003C2F96D3